MSTTATYSVGDFVRATWKGKGPMIYDAYVEAVHQEEGAPAPTYTLIYSDGDMDAAALPQYITPYECKARADKIKCEGLEGTCTGEYIEWRRRCPLCKTPNPNTIKPTFAFDFNINWAARQAEAAERDALTFRTGYPGLTDDPTANLNVLFFSNQLKMIPDGFTVEEFLKDWKGAYDALESGHSFVQWIFPIREQGLNFRAQPLQKWEAEKIASTPELQDRLIRLYELMLDFYGMRLADRATGALARSHHFEERYLNLCTHPHNFLRITRILKCLHECGLGKYQYPFVQHVLTEIYEHNQLKSCASSAKQYWVGVVVDDTEREKLKSYIASKTSSSE